MCHHLLCRDWAYSTCQSARWSLQLLHQKRGQGLLPEGITFAAVISSGGPCQMAVSALQLSAGRFVQGFHPVQVEHARISKGLPAPLGRCGARTFAMCHHPLGRDLCMQFVPVATQIFGGMVWAFACVWGQMIQG